VNVRYVAFRIAARAFPSRDSLRRTVKGLAQVSGVEPKLKGFLQRTVREYVMSTLYPELLSQLKADVGIEGSRQHIEDLIALLDQRVDRLCRELAKQDPALAYEPVRTVQKEKRS